MVDERSLGTGTAMGVLIGALREVQELVVSVDPPADVLDACGTQLGELAARLRPWVVDEEHALAGRRVELPGRGHPLLPPFLVDHQDASSITGRVTLGRFYLGRYGAAHGGVIPLLFDDVLGRLSNTSGALSRTAYLKVDYRRITPIGPELHVEATVDREEGRKQFLSGRLFDGTELVADAEGLFIIVGSSER